jgi:hypothetical protein
MSTDKLRNQLEDLALKITSELLNSGEPTKETVDAFKAVSSYFAATRRLNAKAGASEDEGTSFSGFRKRIAAASAGNSGASGTDRTNGSGAAPDEPTDF